MVTSIKKITDNIIKVLISDNTENFYSKTDVFTRLKTSDSYRLELFELSGIIIEETRDWEVNEKLRLVFELNGSRYIEAQFVSYKILLECPLLVQSLSRKDVLSFMSNVSNMYFTDLFAKAVLFKAIELGLVHKDIIIILMSSKLHVNHRIAILTLELLLNSGFGNQELFSVTIRLLNMTKASNNIHVKNARKSLVKTLEKVSKDWLLHIHL